MTKKKTPSRGRPIKDPNLTARLPMTRCTEDERTLWTAIAREKGLSVGALVRLTMRAEFPAG